MNNSTIKAKIIEAIRWWPISLVVLVFCFFVYISEKRDLTSLEMVLLQFISLAIGCGVSFWVGKQANRKAEEDTLKSKARDAALYLISLSKSIWRARTIASIELPQQLELHEDYHVVRGALIAISTEQLDKANEALEYWSDILGDELEVLIQNLQEEKITPEKSEDFAQKLTYYNTTEDR